MRGAREEKLCNQKKTETVNLLPTPLALELPAFTLAGNEHPTLSLKS